jgi:hypothetical protein
MMHTCKLMLSRGHGKPANVECMVELELNLDAIAGMLGQKAMRNKSKRSRALSNTIVANVRLTTSQIYKDHEKEKPDAQAQDD